MGTNQSSLGHPALGPPSRAVGNRQLSRRRRASSARNPTFIRPHKLSIFAKLDGKQHIKREPDPITCTECDRWLQPPPGVPSFLCPCGTRLNTPTFKVDLKQYVRCPYCQILLDPPPGDEVFRCDDCGRALQPPKPEAEEEPDPNAIKKKKKKSSVTVLQFPSESLTDALKRVSYRWTKDVNMGGENLSWYRVLNKQELDKLEDLQQSLGDDDASIKSSIKSCSKKRLKRMIAAMGLEPPEKNTRKHLEATVVAAPATLATLPKQKLLTQLERLGVNCNNLTDDREIARMVFLAAWEVGNDQVSAKSYVRNFDEETKSIDWTPTEEYVFQNEDTDDLVATAEELKDVSTKPFVEKMIFFKDRVARLRVPWESGHVKVKVNRATVLQDSFECLSKLQDIDFRRMFRFKFYGEPGLDAGGIAREWYQLLFDQLFDPAFGLFQYSGMDNLCYQINPNSGLSNDKHLEYLRFMGIIVGKAIFDSQVLEAHLTRPLYKHILAFPITRRDLEFVDPQIARSMEQVLACDNAEDLFLDFTTTTQDASTGEVTVADLVPGGQDVDVTNENRQEYVDALFKHFMLGATKHQLYAFLSGFYLVIPLKLISIFDHQELELLMSGLPSIDVADWKANTRYRGRFARMKAKHQVVRWFWHIVEHEFSEEERARFLQFATGTSRVPVAGFAALQANDGKISTFCLDTIEFDLSVFPKAHTCFNRIEMPLYPSLATMKKYILQAMRMEASGFALE